MERALQVAQQAAALCGGEHSKCWMHWCASSRSVFYPAKKLPGSLTHSKYHVHTTCILFNPGATCLADAERQVKGSVLST